LSCRCVN